MDDEMIDLMAGDVMLRRRLEAYADARLSPDLVASSRMRARVLAVAHRQADLGRADSGLTVLPGSRPRSARVVDAGPSTAGQPRKAWRRTTTSLLAASFVVVLMTGTVLAARPGGGLYDARLWLETITLPGDPSARAVAELGRLAERIREARDAARAGDPAAAAAALAAYERIVDQASAAAIASQDPVAAAALEVGVGQNIAVLEGLLTHVPTQARGAIERVIDRAVERSDAAVDAIDTGNGSSGKGGSPAGTGNSGNGSSGNGGGNSGNSRNGGNGGNGGPDDRTPRPTKPPKPAPTNADNGSAPGGPDGPNPGSGKTPPPRGN